MGPAAKCGTGDGNQASNALGELFTPVLCSIPSPYFTFVLETGSHVGQVSLKFPMWQRLALNCGFSCGSSGMQGVQVHTATHIFLSTLWTLSRSLTQAGPELVIHLRHT